MNWSYATPAIAVLLLSALGMLLAWCAAYGLYLNRIGSHGWASTRRLLFTLGWVLPISVLVCATWWEDGLAPLWILAHLGRSSSQMELARRYAVGDRLLAKDEGAARQWTTRAARAGSSQGQYVLGSMNWTGQGLPKSDPASAMSWARLAAAQGLPEAQILAGQVLLQAPTLAGPGETAQAFFLAALPQLQARAGKGDGRALFSLGMLKLKGLIGPADPEGGLRMLLKAQRLGIDPYQGFTLSIVRSKLPAEVVQRAEATALN